MLGRHSAVTPEELVLFLSLDALSWVPSAIHTQGLSDATREATRGPGSYTVTNTEAATADPRHLWKGGWGGGVKPLPLPQDGGELSPRR